MVKRSRRTAGEPLMYALSSIYHGSNLEPTKRDKSEESNFEVHTIAFRSKPTGAVAAGIAAGDLRTLQAGN